MGEVAGRFVNYEEDITNEQKIDSYNNSVMIPVLNSSAILWNYMRIGTIMVIITF